MAIPAVDNVGLEAEKGHCQVMAFQYFLALCWRGYCISWLKMKVGCTWAILTRTIQHTLQGYNEAIFQGLVVKIISHL